MDEEQLKNLLESGKLKPEETDIKDKEIGNPTIMEDWRDFIDILSRLRFLRNAALIRDTVPTYMGKEGEEWLVSTTGTRKLCYFLGGTWQCSDVGGSYLKNIVEDITPQLGGDLDMNGKAIDFPTTPNISDCLDEDNMASNSATKLATQQSIKAYIDTQIATKQAMLGANINGRAYAGNNNYLAATDGFLYFYYSAGNLNVNVYTEASNPATAMVFTITSPSFNGSFLYPIKKGNYYRVYGTGLGTGHIYDATGADSYYSFIPLNG